MEKISARPANDWALLSFPGQGICLLQLLNSLFKCSLRKQLNR